MALYVLQMSLSASALIVAVFALRALLLFKLPKKTFVFLWGVAAFRLIAPVSLPSELSFQNAVAKLSGQPLLSGDALALAGNGKPRPPLLAGSLPFPGSSFDVATLVWLIGACAFLLFFAASYIAHRVKFRNARPVESGFVAGYLRRCPLRRPVRVSQTDKVKSPLTYGVLRPVILLPETADLSDETRLEHVFAHECAHIRRFDNLFKLLVTFAFCVHWFNPLVWLMRALANRDIELACDEAVVRKLGANARAPYAATLVRFAEKNSAFPLSCSSFSRNSIEERVTAIMKTKKLSLPLAAASVLLAIGLTLVFATAKAADVGPGESAAGKAVLSAQPPDVPAPAETGAGADLPQPSAGGEPAASKGAEKYRVSMRYYPITGETLLTRHNLETGESQVSFDNGETWLYRRVDPETMKPEYSADKTNWTPAPAG